MNRFQLFWPEPVDLALCVTSGQVFRWALREGVWEGVDAGHVYRISELPTGEIEVETTANREAFERLFRLDVSITNLERALVAEHPELTPTIDSLRGLRLMRPSSAEETFFSFLCTPNNHLTRITKMVQALARYGEPLEGGFTRFPTAGRIAQISESELRSQGFGYRGASIPRVAALVAERGEGWLDTLRANPNDSDSEAEQRYLAAQAELMALPSVGPKLADCICLLGLDHLHAAPLDTHLWQAATRLYRPEWHGQALTDQRYRALSQELRARFGRLTGYAHQYLFYDNLLRHRGKR